MEDTEIPLEAPVYFRLSGHLSVRDSADFNYPMQIVLLRAPHL